ncbi:hypothetical protein ACFWBF_31665, partial [Streptomyces sp. NPDC060028]
MTTTVAALVGRTALAGLLCAALAACGSTRAGQAAGPAPAASPGKETCGVGAATEEQPGGTAGPPTDQETGAYAGPPTDEDTGTPGP